MNTNIRKTLNKGSSITRNAQPSQATGLIRPVMFQYSPVQQYPTPSIVNQVITPQGQLNPTQFIMTNTASPTQIYGVNTLQPSPQSSNQNTVIAQSPTTSLAPQIIIQCCCLPGAPPCPNRHLRESSPKPVSNEVKEYMSKFSSEQFTNKGTEANKHLKVCILIT